MIIMKNKYYTIVFLILNILSFTLSKMGLTNNYLSFNNLISSILGNLINVNNYILSSFIFISIITIAFYGLLNLFNIRKKIILFILIIIGLLISLPLLNANGL
jgi:hypothetical protein